MIAHIFMLKSIFWLPNNQVHVARFLNLAILNKDSVSIKIAASNLLDSHAKINWQNILTAYVDQVGVVIKS